MTKEINVIDEEKASKFVSRRHSLEEEFDGAEEGPRLGRRESEPHSFEISTLYDRIKTNFPADRAFWDLTHYFSSKERESIIQFDISYFQNFSIPEMISSYRASIYENRIPDIAFNVLSKNTWRKDLVDNVLKCKQIKIPVYIVYFAYEVVAELLPPPYLRMYRLQPNGEYFESELTEAAYLGKDLINTKAIIDPGEKIPFMIGIQQLDKTYQGGKPLFHLVLLERDSLAIVPTEAELAWEKLHRTELLLKQERQRADELEKQLKQLQKKNRNSHFNLNDE